MTPEKIAQVLLSQINSHETLDKFSFKVFSQLIMKEQHEEAALALARKLKDDKDLSKDLSLMMKLRDLFSSPGKDLISETYRKNLNLLFGSISLGEGFSFDRDSLKERFRFLLLVVFFLDDDGETISRSIDDVLSEMVEAIEKNDLNYIRKFTEILLLKIKRESSDQDLIDNLKKKVSLFAEDVIFSDQVKGDKTWLAQLVTVRGNNMNYYLDKIFNKKKVSSTILTFFFKFFPDGLDPFYRNIDIYINDIAFLNKIMDSLEKIDFPASADVLKYLHLKGNNYIKLEALKRMRQVIVSDADFLFTILQGKEILQRKEIWGIIAKNPDLQNKAATIMLRLTNPFGMRTKVILNNLDIVKEIPFEQTKTYLLVLSEYRFFWNRLIRKMAKSILESMHAG